jgi:thiamine biosynthesis lipoprotein
MRSLTRLTALLPSFLLATLAIAAAGAPALAAPKPGKANRAAAATGPRVERSLAILGETLAIVAASRVDVTDTTRTAAAIGMALDEAARLEAILSPDREGSELTRLNRAAAQDRFACSGDLFAALDTARELAGETDGAYDPTLGPLARVWAAQGGRGAPDRLELSAARALVGWRMLLLEPGLRTARFTRPGMSVALGAVAGGHVLDRTADALRAGGIVRARLELGGTILAFTSHDPWVVSVPGWDSRAVLSLALSNAACATALQPGGADAESGARGRSPIDPRTGESARGQASVTVIAPSAARAGALAAALLVMGRDGAEAHARARPDLGVLWIEPAGDLASVRVWAWNLGTIEPRPGVRVEWMTHP